MKLITENLEKVFRTELVETVALNGVSIEVNDGEFVAIMGRRDVENLRCSISLGCWITLQAESIRLTASRLHT